MRESAVSHKDLIDEAKRVLYGNLKVGYSRWAGSDYKFVSPSPHHYPHQWFWDSCFHAIVLSHFDLHLAKNEVTSLLKGQSSDGFIPHMIYWQRGGLGLPRLVRPLESKPSFNPKTSALMQPPLIVEAVDAVFKKEKDIQFLQDVLPKLVAYYNWLARERDPDDDGLISIIAPYESGLDQSPSYDPVLGIENKPVTLTSLVGRTVTFRNMMRSYNQEKIFEAGYFDVEDVLVNSIYAKNLQVLSRLLHEIDREETARSFHHLAIKCRSALIKKCFDKNDGFFYDLYGREEQIAKVKTVKGLIPLILDLPDTTVRTLINKHLLNKNEFGLPFPLPSVSQSERSFSPSPAKIAKEPLLWRGPTWINTNWYIIRGLRHQGYRKEANNLIEKSVELIKTSGFREFFNPYTGEGYGVHNFGWSTLIVDMLLS